MRASGAIPLLVTSTPELCMMFETYNKIIGTTNNPYDLRRTPSGSSGGEVRTPHALPVGEIASSRSTDTSIEKYDLLFATTQNYILINSRCKFNYVFLPELGRHKV
jgi:hypothetical protein